MWRRKKNPNHDFCLTDVVEGVRVNVTARLAEADRQPPASGTARTLGDSLKVNESPYSGFTGLARFTQKEYVILVLIFNVLAVTYIINPYGRGADHYGVFSSRCLVVQVYIISSLTSVYHAHFHLR